MTIHLTYCYTWSCFEGPTVSHKNSTPQAVEHTQAASDTHARSATGKTKRHHRAWCTRDKPRPRWTQAIQTLGERVPFQPFAKVFSSLSSKVTTVQECSWLTFQTGHLTHSWNKRPNIYISADLLWNFLPFNCFLDQAEKLFLSLTLCWHLFLKHSIWFLYSTMQKNKTRMF